MRVDTVYSCEGEGCGPYVEATLDSDGDWVAASDYDALEAEVIQLRATHAPKRAESETR